ncbi:hypothetical protein RUM44_001065 [Polyplax serrata]|uniref:Dynein regulatory complex subunit 7 n=1 Tax=Polyplax serrata TaxID=468196 RepID=A0ABR1B9E6_POLSC
MPDHINSPQTVLRKQAGHSFEYSTLLASFLIASAYDAYVVSGYATREICQMDQTRIECPLLTDDEQILEEAKIEEDSKYYLKKPLELKSMFLQEMLDREIRKEKEAQRIQELAELAAVKEFEKPWPDELYGWRLHSWVVILPSKDVTEPIFIESTTGLAKSLDDPEYHGIESLWNHQNYWVCVQFDNKTENCKDISFNLNDIECWERLLIGEPFTFRKFGKEILEADAEEYKRACIQVEKHLDMPGSWVDILKLSHSSYEKRFPRAKKVIHYRKAISEQYPPYSHADGLVERVKRYFDYECQEPREIRERYKNRADRLYYCQKTVVDNSVLEKFDRGREDALKEHFYYAMDSGIEVVFSLKFYHQARLDCLSEFFMDPLFMIMHFKKRPDFLYYVRVDFAERTNHDQPLRNILKIEERYNRNTEKDADKDVAIVEYCFQEKKVHLRFHYEFEHITQTDRLFNKPVFAERGASLTYDPALTKGYLTGPTTPNPKPLYLYRLESEYFKREEISEKKIRERENELLCLLRLRAQELAAPRLVVSEFDVERNDEAKKAYKEREQREKEMSEGEMNLMCDFLAPYYVKLDLDAKSILSNKMALTVIDDFLHDWKCLLVARANDIQQQFEQTCHDFNEKNNWYEENQSVVTKEQEEEYFEYCKKKSYYLHILEVRLNRHKELAPRRFLAVHSYLKNDPRLARAFHKSKKK